MACILGVACRHFFMHHACISWVKKRATHIKRHSDIFWEKFAETNWIFEFLSGKYPISKKKLSKTESGKCSHDRFKINKISMFFENNRTIFKVSYQIYLDLLHYKKRKWICLDISMVDILHQIRANIYIFKKIFK